jgi:hypothetical protein
MASSPNKWGAAPVVDGRTTVTKQRLMLEDLVRSRTLSASMAASLATAAEERRSILVVAIPRLAGKTTMLMATLAHMPSDTTLHHLSEECGPGLGIPAEADGGYLVMAEIARTQMPHYLWGEPVRQVFGSLRRGFSLATALHADGIDQAFAIIHENEVPDEDVAQLDLMVYIRSLGEDWRHPTRRVVEEVYEINGVVAGEPDARRLHRWNEAADRFEDVESPLRIGTASGVLAKRARAFADFEPA